MAKVSEEFNLLKAIPQIKIEKIKCGDLHENKKKCKFFEKFLGPKFCDCLLISTVIQVNVVGFWRGLFGIFSFFHEFSHLWLIYLLGGIVQLQFSIWQSSYFIHLKQNKITHSILRKVYAYTNGSTEVMRWIGLWAILEQLSGLDIRPAITYSIVSYVILVLFKFSNNLLAPPCFVAMDPPAQELFGYETAFKTSPTKKKNSELLLYILDCFFSVFVIGSLVVFTWRGVWCLTDVFLFPENEKYSALSSLAIGYALVFIIFGFQNLMEQLCEKLTGFWRLFLVDIYVFISFIGTINLWRGIWHLLNIYFLPEFPILGYWISHLGCFAFLVLIKCSNTILTRGVYLDGEDGGKCIVFSTFYFTLFFQEKMKNKGEDKEIKINMNTCGENEEHINQELKNSKTNNIEEGENI